MKRHVWIAIVAWAAMLSTAVGQAVGQAKCDGGTSRCVSCAQVDKSKPRGVKGLCACQATCQKADADETPACGPKMAGKDESACGLRPAQKIGSRVAHNGPVMAEPRRLALPHGTYRRLKDGDDSKAGSDCSCKQCRVCRVDTRHEAIFGTDTIFGDLGSDLFDDGALCPYGHAKASRPNALGQALAKLDASLQRVFVCPRESCGGSNGKVVGGEKSGGKGDCRCDFGTAPILDGQAEEPEPESSPFRDDALQPAPLPPTPRMTGTTSRMDQTGEGQRTPKRGMAQAKLVSSPTLVPVPQIHPPAAGEQGPNRVSPPEKKAPGQSAQPRLTLSQSRDDAHELAAER